MLRSAWALHGLRRLFFYNETLNDIWSRTMMFQWKAVVRVVALLVGMFAASCGPSVCSGSSCACAGDESCSFNTCGASTAGCNFSCESNATCTGECGANCNVNCHGKSCTHTVGAGSNVACLGGTCDITCNGACTVAGSPKLTCKGGTTQSIGGCI